MYQPPFTHNQQQKSTSSNPDRDVLSSVQQTASFSTQYDSPSNSNIASQGYDTPTRQSYENNIPSNFVDSIQDNIPTISSADYALNVIFSQFEQLADAKMSLILNMGVVTVKVSMKIYKLQHTDCVGFELGC